MYLRRIAEVLCALLIVTMFAGLTLIAVAQCEECDNCDTCDNDEQDNCFGEFNDPCSRTGFTPGVVEACNDNVCACPFPPDAYLECCDQLEDACEEVEANICYQELVISADEEATDQERQLKLEVFPRSGGEDVVNRGVVKLGTAGGGVSFFSDSIVVPRDQEDCDPDGFLFNEQLAGIGFTVVDRAWEFDGGGWTDDSAVPTRVEASRYPALVKYVWDNYHCPDEGGAFVAVGISGGSSEIAFGLSSYGLEDYIDVAILLSGPANADLELTCDQSDPDWCDNLWSSTCPNAPWGWCGEESCGPPTCIFDDNPLWDGFPAYEETCLVDNCLDAGDPVCHRQQSVLFDPEDCEKYDRTIVVFAEGGGDGNDTQNQVGPTGALLLFDKDLQPQAYGDHSRRGAPDAAR